MNEVGINEVGMNEVDRALPGTAAIILAAGFSSRMGAFKPLLRLGQSTAVERSVRGFLNAGVNNVTVVVGHRYEEMVQVVQFLGALMVVNSQYREGMFSSVQAGVTSLRSDVQAFFLLPVDCPVVQSSTIRQLYAAYQGSGKDIAYPVFRGQRGHPPLISTCLSSEILESKASSDGLRGVLRQHEAAAVDVSVEDHGILIDMDVPSDYRDLQAHLQRTGE
ncbi:NTP transferase domain-containing protein [Alicyclobacillus sp. SO9]|uniref:nucleotidyltransferase family protein n=1 Tax=Alicyclobacillus sp. SO9 TaxID=2665646 RepID=UPI0018E75723|nr:nucleotidyltransferase family protein [Alicyclobacillus sp. SO9]QQE80595.1 nucleotidyltransferase family protein [Alicyclobacillus sp. SO9]